MLKLCPIDEDRLETAATLLAEGFPVRSRAFWRRGLRRLAEYNRETGAASMGNFLMAQDRPVGILLTIARQDGMTGRKIVNLSSWYVQESHRWCAARLVMAAVADPEAIYTDLTPTRAAADINARLGFRSIGFKRIAVILPRTALARGGRARLVPLDAVPAGALCVGLLRDLERHRDLGCIVTVVEAGGRFHPVVFDVAVRKGIRVARVVFAERLSLVTENLAAFSRMLILRGVPVLILQIDEDADLPHSVVLKRGLCHQVKGEWDDRTIDELYSERVLLKV